MTTNANCPILPWGIGNFRAFVQKLQQISLCLETLLVPPHSVAHTFVLPFKDWLQINLKDRLWHLILLTLLGIDMWLIGPSLPNHIEKMLWWRGSIPLKIGLNLILVVVVTLLLLTFALELSYGAFFMGYTSPCMHGMKAANYLRLNVTLKL
ncbi:unnamed protein product [Prunus brigantina]